MYVERGEGASARPIAEEALAVNQQVGESWAAAFSCFMLGQGADESGNHRQALKFFERSRDAFRALGNENYALLSSRAMGRTFYELGGPPSGARDARTRSPLGA